MAKPEKRKDTSVKRKPASKRQAPSPVKEMLQAMISPKWAALSISGLEGALKRSTTPAPRETAPQVSAREMLARGILGIGLGPKQAGPVMTPTLVARVYVREKIPRQDLGPESLVPGSLLINGMSIPTDVVEIGDVRPLAHDAGDTGPRRKRTGNSSSTGEPTTGGFFPTRRGKGGGYFPTRRGGSGGYWPFSGNRPFAVFGEDQLKELALLKSAARPLYCGMSIGPVGFQWSGTLGCFVKDKQDKRYMLSNNHVLAGGRDLGDVPVPNGTNVTQPSGPDQTPSTLASLLVNAGAEATPVAALSRLIQLKGGQNTTNYVDAAIAELAPDIQYANELFGFSNEATGRFHDLRPPTTAASQDLLYTAVAKVGRTTGLTMGVIVDTQADMYIPYGDVDDFDSYAWFEDQLLVSAINMYTTFSAPGDSGSAVWDAKTRSLIGLLFAGSEEFTVINPIANVFDALDVSLA